MVFMVIWSCSRWVYIFGVQWPRFQKSPSRRRPARPWRNLWSCWTTRWHWILLEPSAHGLENLFVPVHCICQRFLDWGVFSATTTACSTHLSFRAKQACTLWDLCKTVRLYKTVRMYFAGSRHHGIVSSAVCMGNVGDGICARLWGSICLDAVLQVCAALALQSLSLSLWFCSVWF